MVIELCGREIVVEKVIEDDNVMVRKAARRDVVFSGLLGTTLSQFHSSVKNSHVIPAPRPDAAMRDSIVAFEKIWSHLKDSCASCALTQKKGGQMRCRRGGDFFSSFLSDQPSPSDFGGHDNS